LLSIRKSFEKTIRMQVSSTFGSFMIVEVSKVLKRKLKNQDYCK
jgi:hypothetical protein